MEVTIKTFNTPVRSTLLVARAGEIFQFEPRGTTYIRLAGTKYMDTCIWTIYDFSDPDNCGKEQDAITIIGSIWIDG